MRMQATGMRLDRRDLLRVLAALAMFVAALSACAEVAFKTTRVRVGSHPLKVEIAASDPERMQGLMHRTKLGKEDGMLFVFDEPGYHSMWMKNTLIPLSVAFID